MFYVETFMKYKKRVWILVIAAENNITKQTHFKITRKPRHEMDL